VCEAILRGSACLAHFGRAQVRHTHIQASWSSSTEMTQACGALATCAPRGGWEDDNESRSWHRKTIGRVHASPGLGRLLRTCVDSLSETKRRMTRYQAGAHLMLKRHISITCWRHVQLLINPGKPPIIHPTHLWNPPYCPPIPNMDTRTYACRSHKRSIK